MEISKKKVRLLLVSEVYPGVEIYEVCRQADLFKAAFERSLVVKQPSATFRCVPGSASHRPSQATPIPNLFLAGEWTDTGWPSTMEGAVRSGVYAAEALASNN